MAASNKSTTIDKKICVKGKSSIISQENCCYYSVDMVGGSDKCTWTASSAATEWLYVLDNDGKEGKAAGKELIIECDANCNYYYYHRVYQCLGIQWPGIIYFAIFWDGVSDKKSIIECKYGNLSMVADWWRYPYFMTYCNSRFKSRDFDIQKGFHFVLGSVHLINPHIRGHCFLSQEMVNQERIHCQCCSY